MTSRSGAGIGTPVEARTRGSVRHVGRRNARLAGVFLTTAAVAWLATEGPGFGDEGLFLVLYDHWLRVPERVAEAGSAYWLSNLLGALWLWAMPLPGVLAMRAGALAMFVLSATLAWVRLRRAGACWLVPVLALTVGLALLSGYRYMEYTVFTSAALVVTGVALVNTADGRRGGAWAALAGCVIGMSILLRTPNISMVALAAVPPLVSGLMGGRLSDGWRRAGVVLASTVAGLLIVWVVIYATGHAALLGEAVREVAGRSTHSPERLIRVQVRTWTNLLLHGAGVLAAAYLVTRLAAWSGGRRAVPIQASGIVVLAAGYTVGPFEAAWYYAVGGSAVLICAALVAGILPADGSARHDALLGVLLPFFIGLGSAALPWPLLLAMWFTLPVALLYGLRDGSWGQRVGTGPWLQTAAVAVIAILALHVLSVAPYLASMAGRGPAQLPHERRYAFADARLALMHSSRDLTLETDALLPVLDTLSGRYPQMISTNGVPLAIHLAAAESFLMHPHVELVGPDTARRYVEEALERVPPWPVWVRARYRVAADFAIHQEPGSSFGDMPAVRELVEGRLLALGYELLWENRLFQIYGPPMAADPSAGR